MLGLDVLRKLHNSNVKIATSEMLAQHPINSQETAPAKDTSANTALKQALNVHDKKDPIESTPVKKSKPEPSAPKSKLAHLAPKPSQPVPSSVTPAEPSLPDKKPIKIKLRIPANSIRPPVPLAASSLANVVPVGL